MFNLLSTDTKWQRGTKRTYESNQLIEPKHRNTSPCIVWGSPN